MADLVSCYDSRRIYSFYHEAKEILAGKMPKPRMCLLYPSRVCNHNCFYCSDRWDNKKLHRLMDNKEFLKLPKRLKDFGVESIELCGGGEPLLHPQIKKFIKEAVGQGLKLASLTNGTMIKDKLLQLMVKHFSYFRVSVDTFNPETLNKLRRPRSKEVGLERVLGNVKRAVALKKKIKSPVRIGLKILVTRDNVAEIIESVNKAREIGVDSITIKTDRNTGGEQMTSEEVQQGEQMLQFCKQNYDDILILGSLQEYKIDHRCWLSPCHIFIDTTGDVRLCCYYQFRKKTHTYGNIFKQSIEEVWYSKKHFEAIKISR